MKHLTLLPILPVLVLSAGCLSVKTESEIKPIHITMDVNLRVDQKLDNAFGEEDRRPQQGGFQAIKDLLDRGAAGFNREALLEAREGATGQDRVLIAEDNARRMKRYDQIAKETGVSIEAVQQRRAAQFADRVPAGSGVWIQAANGTWSQK